MGHCRGQRWAGSLGWVGPWAVRTAGRGAVVGRSGASCVVGGGRALLGQVRATVAHGALRQAEWIGSRLRAGAARLWWQGALPAFRPGTAQG